MLQSLPAINPLQPHTTSGGSRGCSDPPPVWVHFAMKSKGCDQTIVLITPSDTTLEIHNKNVFILLHCDKLCCSILDVFSPSLPLKLMTLRQYSLVVQAVTDICIKIDMKTCLQKLKS